MVGHVLGSIAVPRIARHNRSRRDRQIQAAEYRRQVRDVGDRDRYIGLDLAVPVQVVELPAGFVDRLEEADVHRVRRDADADTLRRIIVAG